MSVMKDPNKGNTPHYVGNGVAHIKKLQAANMVELCCTGGGGLFSIRGPEWCVTQVLGNSGGGVHIMSPAKSGLGDGTETPGDERRTKSFVTQTGDKSVPTLVALCCADGTGMTIQSGGGGKPIINIRTENGQNGILVTEKYVALYSYGVELVVDANRGLVFATNFRVQESIDGAGKVVVRSA